MLNLEKKIVIMLDLAKNVEMSHLEGKNCRNVTFARQTKLSKRHNLEKKLSKRQIWTKKLLKC